MKKILALILALTTLVTLISCGTNQPPQNPDNGSENNTPVTARVGYFPGTTGIGMAKMISDAPEEYTFTKYNGPTFITAALQAGELDIAAYPTNAVPGVYKATENGVQMLAINTLGVLYICTNGVTVQDISDLSGKTVYYPEEAPKKVLEYVLAQNNITDVTLKASTLDALPGAIVSDTEVQIAILPEPKVTIAQVQANKAGNTNFKIALDISAEWAKVSDQPLVQGCVVVSKAFAEAHPDVVNDFLKKYEESILFVKDPANLDAAAQMVVDAEILPQLPIAKQAIPRSNITFMAGDAMVTAASSFLTAFGVSVPGNDFFYIAKTNA